MSTKVFSYKTIGAIGESEYKDRGSKFLGICVEVKNRDEIKDELKRIKSLHPKANHHCYAWRLGTEGIDFRTSDNGEPSGSAGRPIMRQIDSAGVTNVLVVVVRYFGGTLLGIPGLVKAYKTTAEECLTNTTTIEKEVCRTMSITFSYPQLNEIMKLIKKMKIQVLAEEMELFCMYKVDVPLRHLEKFLVRIERLEGVSIAEDKPE